jgi:hypothetical protein
LPFAVPAEYSSARNKTDYKALDPPRPCKLQRLGSLQNKEDKKKFGKIRAKYKIAEEHGAEIKAVSYNPGRAIAFSLRECRFLKEYDKGFY